MIDRLEKAGFAQRVRDASDRRRVIVEPDREQIERRIVPLFESMGRRAVELYSGYSVRDLMLIRDFAVRSLKIAEEETRKLRDEAAPAATRRGT